MKIEKREYEERAVAYLRGAIPKHRRVLAVAPTGAGKTVIVAQLLQREKRWRKVLFLAHSIELIDQAHARLADVGIKAGVIMAADENSPERRRTDPNARVQVASVQTIARRGAPDDVDLIVFDEAHRTMADSYLAIAAQCPSADVLGITATPSRIDGKGLGDFYHHLHVMAQPSELYASGHLAKPRVFSAPASAVQQIRAGLRLVKGAEYPADGAAKVMNKAPLIGSIVGEVKRLAPGVPKVLFACNREHSRTIVRRLNKAGIGSEHLDGETPAGERDAILARLRSGETECVCNVNVLAEGWDLPQLGAVIIARPTKSLTRLLQMTGRVQRPHKGPPPVVLDHGANVLRLQFIPGDDREWSLRETEEVKDQSPVVIVCADCLACIPAGCGTCPHCGAAQPRSEREIEEEGKARLVEYRRDMLERVRKVAGEYAAKVGAPEGWADRLAQAVVR